MQWDVLSFRKKEKNTILQCKWWWKSFNMQHKNISSKFELLFYFELWDKEIEVCLQLSNWIITSTMLFFCIFFVTFPFSENSLVLNISSGTEMSTMSVVTAENLVICDKKISSISLLLWLRLIISIIWPGFNKTKRKSDEIKVHWQNVM